jgi:hypothetical protein
MSGQDRCVRNSMADHIDAGYLLSQIQLLRDAHQGAFLLVEGDTDQLVYERFIATDAYEERFFLSSKLYQSLAAWQARNAPFTVLCAPLFAGARGAATKEPHGGDPTS